MPTPETQPVASLPGGPLVVRRVRLDDLHADPANANTHPERNMRSIKASLAEFGQVEPLVVHAGTNKVIGGNGRLVALYDMGLTECDVVEFAGTPAQAIALGIALNRSAELAERDDAVLAELLRGLQSEDFPIEAAGFTGDELDALIEGMGDALLPADADGKEYDESVENEVEYHECPQCNHRWPK